MVVKVIWKCRVITRSTVSRFSVNCAKYATFIYLFIHLLVFNRSTAFPTSVHLATEAKKIYCHGDLGKAIDPKPNTYQMCCLDERNGSFGIFVSIRLWNHICVPYEWLKPFYSISIIIAIDRTPPMTHFPIDRTPFGYRPYTKQISNNKEKCTKTEFSKMKHGAYS